MLACNLTFDNWKVTKKFMNQFKKPKTSKTFWVDKKRISAGFFYNQKYLTSLNVFLLENT